MFKTSRNCNSVKIVLDFTGASRLLGNNSVIPFLTAAEKRHFHPPKLPALWAEVDGLAQKSASPFSCFAACSFSLCRKPPTGDLLPCLPLLQRSRAAAQRPLFCCWMGTRSAVLRKPHIPPTRARRAGISVLAVRLTRVFNKIGIFPPCHVLIQLLHLPVIVLLECRLNRLDCE